MAPGLIRSATLRNDEAERRLIGEYFELMNEIASLLTPANYAVALELASLPDEIRGYGHVKDASLARFQARRRELLEKFHSPSAERKTTSDPQLREVAQSTR